MKSLQTKKEKRSLLRWLEKTLAKMRTPLCLIGKHDYRMIISELKNEKYWRCRNCGTETFHKRIR